MKKMELSHKLTQGGAAAWPICLGYLPIGLAFGVLAQKAGLSPFQVALMSMFVFAGSSQFIAVSMLSAGASFTAIVATTFMVNLRHLLMSSSLAAILGRKNRGKLSLFAYGVTDESFAINYTRLSAGDWGLDRSLVVNHTAEGGDPESECGTDVCSGSASACRCDDGLTNGNETALNCGGGTCPGCAAGLACNGPSDCLTGVCTNNICQPGTCGDGVIQGNEQCDDGNQINTDACPDDTSNGGTCQDAFCGDGFILAGTEQCDDGNLNNNDDCPDDTNGGGACQDATCDDGFFHSAGTNTETDLDCGGTVCHACPDGLLLSEIVTTPTAGEFVEMVNPTGTEVSLSYAYLADYNTYYGITQAANPPGSTDFRARFPMGTSIPAGSRR